MTVTFSSLTFQVGVVKDFYFSTLFWIHTALSNDQRDIVQLDFGVVQHAVYVFSFMILGGYLPLRFFQWTNLNGKASHRYVSARHYTTNNLCRWFGGMNRELLPLCAVLTGNDYGAPKEAETLLDLIDVSALGGGGGRRRGRSPTSRIEGLLIWLSSFSSVAEALEEVSRLMCEEGGRGRRGQMT